MQDLAKRAGEGMAPATDYTRFIVLSGPRTGSHMIAQALNSHSQIICFREVFNLRLDFIQFGVEGYDDFDASDISLRKEDSLRFLDERVYCEHPADVQAVGFKFHYSHHWDAPAILERITNDRELRIIHLRRRNALRALVSRKLAETTGVWLQEGQRPITPRTLATALRHPAKAWRRIPRVFRRQRLERSPAPRKQVTISPDEFYEHLIKTNVVNANYQERFTGHAMLDVFYEDLANDIDRALAGALDFLGVRPERLTVTMRRQNPEPLRELISNYDELLAAYRGTEYASYFDE
jgi:hypothetical protein